MNGFDTYDDLLSRLEDRDAAVETLGRSPEGDPIVSVSTGGKRTPGVMITAGTHATEHAGVRAAIEVIDQLETDREVRIVPSRDPVGLNGYENALREATGSDVRIDSIDELETTLRSHGEVLHDDGNVLLTLVGETGFGTLLNPPSDGIGVPLLSKLKDVQTEQPGVLEPFRGRRIIAPGGHPDVEETGTYGRAYTIVVSPTGDVLHLNRFFDRTWAPVETRCTRQVMAEMDPGLVFDLHETTAQADRYHLSLRHPLRRYEDDEARTVANAAVTAVADAGYPIAGDDDIFDGSMDVVGRSEDDEAHGSGSFYTKAFDGGYWVDPHTTTPPRSGEGLNATDYAAEHYGLGFTVETGMYGSFEDRVRAAVVTVEAGIDAFDSLA